MKTVDATPGKYQVVRSVNGCTVSQTLDDGQVVTDDVPGGVSTAVFAFANKLVIDDDSAVVREVFKLAPQQRLTLLGVLGGNADGAIDKYAKCVTLDDMLAVNANYKDDLTSDGAWVYKLTKLQYADKAFSGASGLKRMVLTLPSIVNGYRFLENCAVDYAAISAPNDAGLKASVFIGCKGRELRYRCHKRQNVSYSMSATPNMELGELYAPEATNADSLCPSSSKLHTFSWFVPKLESAKEAFRDCVLTRESAIDVLNALPTRNDNKSHLIKIGIHADNQYDSDVREAMDSAAEKGWTVEEVWNGTATVATYSLRPAPPLPVYAKVDTYTHEDGTEKQMLNWCHGVTSPDGREPEELGYVLFESVGAAREYYGLPEETLTNE